MPSSNTYVKERTLQRRKYLMENILMPPDLLADLKKKRAFIVVDSKSEAFARWGRRVRPQPGIWDMKYYGTEMSTTDRKIWINRMNEEVSRRMKSDSPRKKRNGFISKSHLPSPPPSSPMAGGSSAPSSQHLVGVPRFTRRYSTISVSSDEQSASQDTIGRCQFTKESSVISVSSDEQSAPLSPSKELGKSKEFAIYVESDGEEVSTRAVKGKGRAR